MQLVLGMVSRIGLVAGRLFEYWHRDYSIGLGDRGSVYGFTAGSIAKLG